MLRFITLVFLGIKAIIKWVGLKEGGTEVAPGKLTPVSKVAP